MNATRYAIGIDLGTTHCALSWVDLTVSEGEEVQQGVLPLPQLVAPGTVEARPLLPSFLYLPHPDELRPEELTLPWRAGQHMVVGEFARARGTQTPIRLVASAKSWLSHAGVDRHAPILPQEAPEDVPRISPLQASISYLDHLREAWDSAHPEAPLAQQQLTVTVPASFDPAARELTAEAAESAGLPGAILLEEPQAALYSWIQASGKGWREQVGVGDIILVVDVGGGTTDLSLIAVVDREGVLEPHRLAVGEHILLGGDNMDLALAYAVAAKLEQSQDLRLDPWQLRALAHGCRAAKERLLGSADEDAVPVVVPGRGSRLIGGTVRTELTREEVVATVLDGFFPETEVTARPASRPRTGLTRLGLPYAQDAAITRHLAAFLCRQCGATAELPGFEQRADAVFLRPTAVLFNGGVFKSKRLVDRLMGILNGWLVEAGAPVAKELVGADLDLAVARGAAYYGYVRQGGGVRIRGGTAAAYYVGVESSMPAVPGMPTPVNALCVAPFGMEEGSAALTAPQEFGLVVGEPVRFRFFGSSSRRQDQVGTFLEHWERDELQELGEVEATLPAEARPAGEVVPVRLRAAVTETGTLRLEAVPREGADHWKVEFDVGRG